MAGIINLLSIYVVADFQLENNKFCSIIIQSISMILVKAEVAGPHILPKFLNKPIRVYKPKLNRNQIGIENKNRTIIYQWINLINGKMYVGSA